MCILVYIHTRSNHLHVGLNRQIKKRKKLREAKLKSIFIRVLQMDGGDNHLNTYENKVCTLRFQHTIYIVVSDVYVMANCVLYISSCEIQYVVTRSHI